MSIDVTSATTIARPVAEVAAYAADPATAPEWYENIESARWVTEPPLRVGSRFAFVARFLGRRIAYTYEVIEFVPGERLVMRTASGPIPMETTYRWEAVGADVTRMFLRNRGEAGVLFGRLAKPFMSMAVRRATRKDLARLKAILERTS